MAERDAPELVPLIVEGHRRYDMPPSERINGCTVDAVTSAPRPRSP